MLLTETADQTFLLQYVKDYCEALAENYRIYHKRTLQGNLSGDYPEYAREQLQAMEDGTANLMRFRMQEGKKYYKVVQQEWDEDRQEYRDRSVNSFVDKKTGEVYKASSWKAPAKGVRFDMRIMSHRAMMHDYKQVDWAGGHLYYR